MKITICLMTLLCLAASLIAADINGTTFIIVSAEDKAVVVKNAQGDLKLLKQGDMLGDDISIAGFEDNHVILEGPGKWAPEKIFVEVTGGKTRVTRLVRRPIEKYQFRGGEVESFKTKSH